MLCAEKPRLLALDMDGTLLTSDGKITEASRTAIRASQAAGCEVVLATGRNYDGIPWQELNGVTLDYAITTNGSSLYGVRDRACLYEKCLSSFAMAPVFDWLLRQQVYIDVYVDGRDYVPQEVLPLIGKLNLPEYILRELSRSRTPITGFVEKLRDGTLAVQKCTLNFPRESDGSLHHYAKTLHYLQAVPDITVVDGGVSNLEFTVSSTSKGSCLARLAEQLSIPLTRTMAIGDSENDLEMLQTVGIGVAMGNASDVIRAAAKAVTRTNDEDGVATAIQKFIL